VINQVIVRKVKGVTREAGCMVGLNMCFDSDGGGMGSYTLKGKM
jgi:hypothetical protein